MKLYVILVIYSVLSSGVLKDKWGVDKGQRKKILTRIVPYSPNDIFLPLNFNYQPTKMLFSCQIFLFWVQFSSDLSEKHLVDIHI